MATTMLSNLINPQVMGAFLDKKIVDLIKFAPLAVIGTELQGSAGNTLTMPAWKYIGEAQDLAEGQADTPVILEATSTQVTVKKAVKSVEITDEAVLSAYGDPMGQIETQLSMAIAQKVDNDVISAIRGISAARKVSAELNFNGLADALVKFGEEVHEQAFIFVSPKNYAVLRKLPEFVYIQNGAALMSGHVGSVMGLGVVVSNKVTDAEAFIIRGGAIGIELKREVSVEMDRDILRKTSIVSADRHYVAYVRDESKAIVINVTPQA